MREKIVYLIAKILGIKIVNQESCTKNYNDYENSINKLIQQLRDNELLRNNLLTQNHVIQGEFDAKDRQIEKLRTDLLDIITEENNKPEPKIETIEQVFIDIKLKPLVIKSETKVNHPHTFEDTIESFNDLLSKLLPYINQEVVKGVVNTENNITTEQDSLLITNEITILTK